MDYMLKRIEVFTRFLDDGRICLSNNTAERRLRGIALGRKSWLFAGSDRGGERAAVMLTLIHAAKLNGVGPQAWLADVPPGSPITRSATWPHRCPGTGAAPSQSTALPDRGSTSSRDNDSPRRRDLWRGRGAAVGHGHGHGAGAR